MLNKKKLLFISPVFPSPNGNGLNLRAFQWFNKFLPDYELHLLICPFSKEPKPDESIINKCCSISKYEIKLTILKSLRMRFLFQPESWVMVNSQLKKIINKYDIEFDAIFCFRMYNLPIMNLALNKCPNAEKIFDLDEIESKTRFSISISRFKNTEIILGIKNMIDATLYFIKELQHFPNQNQIYVSSITEKKTLSKTYSNITLFSNKLPSRDKLPFFICEEKRFLFVGNYKYFPNREAVIYIIDKIIPRLRLLTNMKFKFYIVGKKASAKFIDKVIAIPEIKFIGEVENMESIYKQVQYCIVPLNSGGGSSFKVLEAINFGKPLVSTPTGIRGFELNNNKELLIGNNENELADAILKLMQDDNLSKKLSNNAFKWIESNYTYDVPT